MKIIFPTLNWNICKDSNQYNTLCKKKIIYFFSIIMALCLKYLFAKGTDRAMPYFWKTFEQKFELLRSRAGRDWKSTKGLKEPGPSELLAAWQVRRKEICRNKVIQELSRGKKEKVNSWDLNTKALEEFERENKENTQEIKRTVRTLFQSIYL